MSYGQGTSGRVPAPTRRAHSRVRSTAALALVALCALSGCGSLRLHSEVRQKQGEAAAAAWKEVDLKPVFATERENLGKLLDLEAQAKKRQVDAQAENGIRELAAKKLGDYPFEFEVLLVGLVGKDAVATSNRPATIAALRTAQTSLAKRRAAQSLFERSQSFLQSHGAPKFSCAQLTEPEGRAAEAWRTSQPQAAKAADTQLRSATRSCRDLAAAENAFAEQLTRLKAGQIARRSAEWRQGRDTLRQREADAAAAKLQAQEAQAAYEAEVKQRDQGTSTSDRVKEQAQRFQSALQALTSAAGVLGVELDAQQRLGRLDDLLTSLASGDALETDTASKLEVAASMFPRIADDLRAYRYADRGKLVVPLLMQRDLEQARFRSASMLATRQRQDVELLAAIVEASVAQANTVAGASERLQRAKVAGSQALLGPGLRSMAPTERRELLQGIVEFQDAAQRQELELELLALQRRGLIHDEATDLAEINAEMWAALVNASVTQAAEFSALGIKADDIGKILQLLGIFYIGRGVNQ